jgi:hypothetical protein
MCFLKDLNENRPRLAFILRLTAIVGAQAAQSYPVLLLPSVARQHTILDNAVVSPEFTRPSLSRELCIVEIEILCLSVKMS